jgi:hypothetical protein
MSGVTNEYGATQELKKYLTDKGYNVENVPFGTFMGGDVTFASSLDENPYKLTYTSEGDVKAELKKLSEAQKQKIREEIGGPPRIVNPYREKSRLDILDDLTGNIGYVDKGLAGKLAYNKGIFGTELNLNNANWDTFLQSEDEKKKIGFTGIGPEVEGIESKIGPVTAKYNLNTDKYNLGVNYPITDNISFKSGYDSDNAWDAGIYGKWTWGPEPEIMEHRYEQPTELKKFLSKYETYAKGGRVGMGKGGLASLNNYATKRTG